MDPQQAIFVMVDTALRLLGVEVLRAAVWGAMYLCVATYAVLLAAWVRR